MKIKKIDENKIARFEREWKRVVPDVIYKPKNHVFGVFEGAQLLGYSKFVVNAGVGDLRELIVHEGYRHEGYGKILIEHFIAYCRGKRCRKLRLEVLKRNTEALKFYRKLGFRREATLPHDISNATWYTYVKYLK